LRGDDIAGVLASKYIEKIAKAEKKKNIKVVYGCTAPESVTGEIKKNKPTHLVIIDAADMGAKPGVAGLIEAKDVTGASFSTHMLPLKIFLQYLSLFLKCEVVIIGIQPKSLSFGKPCSAIVDKTAKKLAEIIVQCA
ncbi:MAG TPA: hydrogenase maturation protease, partial [Candidatus Omnitrophota bacterium]|nr:hydrogenase maturation protease [Candidatus Omnitrophota bacterium]